MKKQLKLILIIVAATVVLALSWWGISLIPNDNTSVTSGIVQTVDLYTVEQKNILSIEVKNELDEFVITNSENSFTVNGLEDYPIYSSRITSIVSAISDVTAKLSIALFSGHHTLIRSLLRTVNSRNVHCLVGLFIVFRITECRIQIFIQVFFIGCFIGVVSIVNNFL